MRTLCGGFTCVGVTLAWGCLCEKKFVGVVMNINISVKKMRDPLPP